MLDIINNHQQEDTALLNAYRSLSLELFFNHNEDSALIVVTDALDFSRKKNLQEWEGRLLHLRAYFKAEISQNNESSMVDLIEAMKIFEAIEDNEHLKDVYIELGIANYYLKNYEQSIKDYKNAEDIALALNNQNDLALIYSNLGPVYQKLKNYVKAIEICEKAEFIYIELDDEYNYSKSKFNKINTYFLLYPDSIQIASKYNKEIIDLINVFNKYKDEHSLLIAYINVGANYRLINDLNNSIKNLKKAEELAIKTKDYEDLVHIYDQFSRTYELKQDYVNAFNYSKKYLEVHDSLYQVSQSSVIAELQTKYETQKKENENVLLKKDARIKDQELLLKDKDIEDEKQSKYLLYGGLVFSLIVGVSIYTRFRSSQKKNSIIHLQKEDLEKQKSELEEVNKEVMDSIKYAQRIQDAMLKSKEKIGEIVPPHFLLYKPKHLVSGDFYWYAEKKGHLYLAVADCTGHGVPGAMLSMLGISFLNEIHSTSQLLSCAHVLDQLKVKVVKELSENSEKDLVRDGMDISLIRMELSTGKINWAGANNSLFILNKGQIDEVQSDRQPIGYTKETHPFTDHHIAPSKEAIYYLFSDGYIDQFGGERRKKLKNKGFQQKLMEVAGFEFEEQQNQLDHFFEEWKGELDQLDDVTVVGINSPLKMNLRINEKHLLN